MTDPATAPIHVGVRDAWAHVIGQPVAVTSLRAAAVQPVHAYLFLGPAGSGKRAAARAFAAELLAADADARGADGARAAALAADEAHPDLHVFVPEGASISKDEVQAIIDVANRTPVEGDRKVLVLEGFHQVGSQNPKLLKTIEEPSASTVFVILAEDVPPELVAIASRAVRVDFNPVPLDMLVDALVADGIAADVAADAAAAASGDLTRARLLATDGSLAVRRDTWAAVPHRVDGTGHTAAVLTDEVLAQIDAAQTALDDRHAVERDELAERIERYGLPAREQKELERRHKREVRRHRNAELRFGFAVMAREYRDRLASAPDPAPLVEAIRSIHAAAEALIRNPNELLLLQALVIGLPPL